VYNGELHSDYSLCKSFSLEEAEIDAIPDDTSAQIAHRRYKLIMGLSNVKLLRLSGEVVEV
jgi:hypothetical protein